MELTISQISLILIGVIVALIYVYLKWNFNYWKNRGIDGPKPKILFGNFPNIMTEKRNMAYDVDDIYREYKGREKYVGIFSTRIPQLLVIDPDLVRDILIKDFKSFHDNETGSFMDATVDPLLSMNPFFLTGEAWKSKRSEITPAFTSSRIKSIFPIILGVCEKMTKFVKKDIQENPQPDGINAKELAGKFTTEVVGDSIYGIEAGAFTNSKCELHEVGKSILDTFVLFNIYVFVTIIFPGIRKIYSFPLVGQKVEKYFIDIMNQAIEYRLKSNIDRADFLAYLLQLREKKNLSTLEMAAHTMTFFIDGYETSSIVISNTLHMIAKHKEVQERLRKEINDTIERGDEITFEKLNDLPYLDQVMNETLRIKPPLLISGKVCTKDYELNSNKDKRSFVSTGTGIVIPIYSLHHDPEYYPDPASFNPERFSEENGGAKKFREMGVFLPFMDGPRICLGMKFGLTQSKAAIFEIVRNFEISVNKKTRQDDLLDRRNFLCTLEGGIWLDFKTIK